MNDKKKKIIYGIVFLILAVLTVIAVISQSKTFSFDKFISYIGDASPWWLIASVLSMLSVILFEGLSVRHICTRLGYKRSVLRSNVWSAADIYFSAITPSATGGQPASAVCMMRDGIPVAVCTVSLLVNLVMYTLAIVVIGVVCTLICPGVFFNFSLISKILIVFGFAIQVGLVFVFLMLIKKDRVVLKIADKFLSLLHKMHIVKDVEKKRESLVETMQGYKDCAKAVSGDKKLIFGALAYNMAQRLALIFVSMFVFLAVGGSASMIPEIIVTQSFVVLGSNAMPVPGSVGVADYLFIDGYSSIIKDAVNIELLSRGISFYCCLILSGVIILAETLFRRTESRRSKL